MKTIITILISIFILIPSVYSQTYTPEWAVRFNAGESSYDLPTKMAVDSAGNVYVTGKSWINGSNYDYSTVKYNTAGVFQWEARYNGPGDYIDEPTGIVVDKSGNVFVTGNSYGGSSDYDFATIKYNSNGVQQWVDRYNGALDSTEKVNSIAVDNSGNIFVSGQSMKYTTIYSNEVITIKYNSSGTRLWVNSYKYFNNTIDEAQTMKLDKAGNVYVVSLTYDYLYYSNNVAHTIKYNSNGVQQWLSNFNRYALSYIYLS
ncbi:MAG: SBBP repeat-containing protein, partial [Ignavibacteria bacterium]|nr:SBBP repeat-containing protein [Ignavibacteria bacterium]